MIWTARNLWHSKSKKPYAVLRECSNDVRLTDLGKIYKQIAFAIKVRVKHQFSELATPNNFNLLRKVPSSNTVIVII